VFERISYVDGTRRRAVASWWCLHLVRVYNEQICRRDDETRRELSGVCKTRGTHRRRFLVSVVTANTAVIVALVVGENVPSDAYY